MRAVILILCMFIIWGAAFPAHVSPAALKTLFQKEVASINAQLVDEDREQQLRALKDLAPIAAEAERLLAFELGQLESQEPKKRLEALKAIDIFSRKVIIVLPGLIQIIKGEDRELRWMAAFFLEPIVILAVETAPGVLKAFNDEGHREVKVAAETVLKTLNLARYRTVFEALGVFQDRNHPVVASIEGLEPFADSILDTWNKLEEGLEGATVDELHRIAATVLEAVLEAGDKGLPPLISALMKHEALDSKAPYGPLQPSSIRAEIKHFLNTVWQQLKEEEKNRLRERYYKKGVAANVLARSLGEVIQEADSRVREKALDALRRLGREAEAAVPFLIEALKDQDSRIRRSAAATLGAIGPEAEAAVPALIEALKDDGFGVPGSAAEALGRIGPEAKAAVPALIEMLKDQDDTVRSSAAWALGGIGLEAKAAVSALIETLKDQDGTVRGSAARAFGGIGSEAKTAVSALIETLKDQVYAVRSSAAWALGKIGPDAVPFLIAALGDENEDVRSSASGALGSIGPDAVPSLIAALGDKNDYVRSSAAWALGSIGPDAIPSLIKTLKDQDSTVRSSAAEALGKVGPGAKAAVPYLMEALKDQNSSVRSSAAAALGNIRTEVEAVLSPLIAALKDVNKDVRRSAAEALGRIGPETKAVVSALIAALKDQDGTVRNSAAEALGRIGPEAKAAVSALIEALKDQDSTVRSSAAEALGGIGPEAKAAVSALTEALKDQDSTVRSSAAWALGGIGPEAKAAVSALIEMLKDQDDTVCSRAAWALGRIGPEAKAAVSALTEALKDQDGTVRNSAAEALGGIGPEAKAAVPALMMALKYDYYRSSTAEALGRIGPEAKAAVPVLIEMLKDQNDYIRRSAAEALGGIGPEAEAAVSALIEALRDQDSTVRSNAAEALGKIGPGAEAAVPALIVAVKDKDWDVHGNVAEALGKIGPAAVPDLIAAMKDPDDSVRRVAAEVLVKIGLAAVPALIAAMKDKDAYSYFSVAEALGKIGPVAVPALKMALKNENQGVRRVAAAALGNIGPKAQSAVPFLIAALEDENEDVRMFAAEALGNIGPEAQSAVPSLIKKLRDQDSMVRSRAAAALGGIGPEARSAVPSLIKTLKDQDSTVRSRAAAALGEIGIEAKTAVPALIEALKDESARVGEVAARALGKLATVLRDAEAMDMIEKLEFVRDAMDADPHYAKTEHVQNVGRAIQYLKAIEKTLWRKALKYLQKLVGKYALISCLFLAYISWAVFLLIVFWIRPRVLLSINDALRPLDFKLPGGLGGITVPARFLLFAGFLNYRMRVLDAWVKTHISSYRKRFADKKTVRDRTVHISVPVTMGQTIPDLTAKHLRPTFKKPPGCLLIWGEGGSGKTSLACQVAKWSMSEDPAFRLCQHLMLPILIEHELDPGEGQNVLMETIGGQLQNLTGQEEPVPDELLGHLLRRRRILVIVDHLSEMSEATRKQINPERRGFPIKALVVTSRLEEELEGALKTIIKPLRIKGNRLSSFMESYLTQQGKRDRFDDPEFFHACGRLSTMVGERDITVLLSKLYAEQMVSAKEDLTGGKLPDNIPDLMLSYLNELNRGVTENKLDDRIVHRDTKVLAWECLRQTFRPSSAQFEDAEKALARQGQDAVSHLPYLEDRLRLIATVLPAKDRFRFLLDPLAEYLAGLYLVDCYGEDINSWRNLLVEADSKEGAPETIKGFLLAVRDCCIAPGREAKIPDFVEQELGKRALGNGVAAGTS